ncbi:MAG TPA: DUF6295 family protein [Anaerolineales bacterium]|nr:DUF6295 family protein [Anaerolineales bacterium]
MCTMIAQQLKVNGSGKSGANWTHINLASVSYDHPYHMPLEYSLNLDFTNQAGERVAVELDADSARKLVETVQEVIRLAEMGGFILHASS